MAKAWQAEARDWIQYFERRLFLKVLAETAREVAWVPILSAIVPAIPLDEAASIPLKLLSEGWNGLTNPLSNSNPLLHERVSHWQLTTGLGADWCCVAAVATAAKLRQESKESSDPTAASVVSMGRILGHDITTDDANRTLAKQRGGEFELTTLLRHSDLSPTIPPWDPDLQTEAQYRVSYAKELRTLTESQVDNYIECVRHHALREGKRFAGVVRRSTLTADMRRLVQWQVLRHRWTKIMPNHVREDHIELRMWRDAARRRCKEIAQSIGLEMRLGRPGRPKRHLGA